VDDPRKHDARYSPIFWGLDRLFIICFKEENVLRPLVDNYERVEQEDYVPSGQAESLFRIFTSAAAARESLSRISLKPEAVDSLKIISMTAEQVMGVIEKVDAAHGQRGTHVRVDVLSETILDNEQRREILFSRLSDKH
jgi:hypothetical protein